jgi:hypothetical protein
MDKYSRQAAATDAARRSRGPSALLCNIGSPPVLPPVMRPWASSVMESSDSSSEHGLVIGDLYKWSVEEALRVTISLAIYEGRPQ